MTPPVQTGVGEKAHLFSPDITPQTFVDDVAAHLTEEDLTGTVPVGWWAPDVRRDWR